MNSTYKTFKLKKGYCHVNNEVLVISMTEEPGKVVNPKFNYVIVFFILMFLLSVFFGIQHYSKGSKMISLIYGIASGILGLNIILNWNKSQDATIYIKDISSIEHKASSSLISDFFIIKYASKGKVKQRVMILSRETKKNEKELRRIKKILSNITEIK